MKVEEEIWFMAQNMPPDSRPEVDLWFQSDYLSCPKVSDGRFTNAGIADQLSFLPISDDPCIFEGVGLFVRYEGN